MSQILDDCTEIQSKLSDTSAKVDQLATKIAALEASQGATADETAAVHAALVSVDTLNAKVNGMLP